MAQPYDEAADLDGSPRPGYGELLEALGRADLAQVAARARTHVDGRGVSFGEHPFLLDPVPRVLTPGEWADLERGIAQRIRALRAFVADAYGDRRIVAAGAVPARVLDSADHYEPDVVGVDVPAEHTALAGLDVVRREDGAFAVLEDNLRTPSGSSYVLAARAAVEHALPVDPPELVDPGAGIDLLVEVVGDPDSAAVVSDGEGNSAWWEHRDLARRLGVPVVTPAELELRGGRLRARVDGGPRELRLVYRRTDEDRLRDERGRPTWIAELLLEPLRAGRLTVVNGPGTGVADDKLAHAYVEAMIRFYLDEEPLLAGVRTFDLGDPDDRAEALDRLPELVVKPRAGYGGQGVMIGPRASGAEREAMLERVRERPEDYVAQETVPLSCHPTVCDGRLEPRHVDLRAFAIGDGALPGGLTRVALERGSMIVNSSQDGGGKDTWVLAG